MGINKDRRPVLTPRSLMKEESYTLIGSASSAGKTIGPRGAWQLLSTSTVASTPTVMYLNTPKLGDYLEAYCTLASSSAGIVLRTASSATTISATSASAYDQVAFVYTGQNAAFRALSSAMWLYLGSTNYLGVSTS